MTKQLLSPLEQTPGKTRKTGPQAMVLRGAIVEHFIFVEGEGSEKKETPCTRMKLTKDSYFEIRRRLGLGVGQAKRLANPLEDTLVLFSGDTSKNPFEEFPEGKRISIIIRFDDISFLEACFRINEPTFILIQGIELA